MQTVFFSINDSLYARLDNQLRTFQAGRCRHIQCGSFTVVVARQFGDGVRLSMQHVGFCGYYCHPSQMFSKPLGVPLYPSLIIILSLNDERSYLPTVTITVFSPYTCHAYISVIQISLFSSDVILMSPFLFISLSFLIPLRFSSASMVACCRGNSCRVSWDALCHLSTVRYLSNFAPSSDRKNHFSLNTLKASASSTSAHL